MVTEERKGADNNLDHLGEGGSGVECGPKKMS